MTITYDTYTTYALPHYRQTPMWASLRSACLLAGGEVLLLAEPLSELLSLDDGNGAEALVLGAGRVDEALGAREELGGGRAAALDAVVVLAEGLAALLGQLVVEVDDDVALGLALVGDVRRKVDLVVVVALDQVRGVEGQGGGGGDCGQKGGYRETYGGRRRRTSL